MNALNTNFTCRVSLYAYNSISEIDYFIDFIEKLNDIDLEDKNDLIQNIKNLSKKLSNTETFTKAKKYYVLQRKKLLKYSYFLC